MKNKEKTKAKITKMISFCMTGEFLTDFYRSIVIEGNWEKALKDLLECVQGISYEIVVSMLTCKTKFIGDSDIGIRIVPEEVYIRDNYIERENYVYCGRVKINDGWYVPYKIITSFCRDDVGNACANVNHVIQYKTKFGNDWYRNVSRYAENYHDIAIHLNTPNEIRNKCICKTTVVLFKQTTSPPIWRKFNIGDAQKAFDEFVSIRGTIKIDGASNYFNECDVTTENKFLTMQNVSRLKAKDIESEKIHNEFLKNQEEWKNEIILLSDKVGEKKGWMFLEIEDPKIGKYKLRVPRIPFEHWALQGTKCEHLIEEWVPVCPPNLKMYMDNQYHSDWVVGAGIDISDSSQYSESLMNSAYNTFAEIQLQMCKFSAAVLLGNGRVTGNVVHPKLGENVEPGSIIVIPNSGKDYYIPAMSACCEGTGAIITEVGGSLVHLVQALIEKNTKIVYVKNACSKFLPNTIISVDCDNGCIEIM